MIIRRELLVAVGFRRLGPGQQLLAAFSARGIEFVFGALLCPRLEQIVDGRLLLGACAVALDLEHLAVPLDHELPHRLRLEERPEIGRLDIAPDRILSAVVVLHRDEREQRRERRDEQRKPRVRRILNLVLDPLLRLCRVHLSPPP